MLSFVACLILGQIESTSRKKVFSTVSGFLISLFFYGLLLGFNIAYILGNYLLMRFLPRKTAATAMTVFSAVCLFAASFYHFHINNAKSGGWDIDLIFMMNFIKFHMLAVNYDNAGKMQDPADKGRDLTERERYFAEPLRERVRFFDFINYFFFCGAAWTGMSHEYRWFDEYINSRGDYKHIPRRGLILPALKRFG